MTIADRVAQIRSVARRLDQLEAERASIDKRIADAMRELAALSALGSAAADVAVREGDSAAEASRKMGGILSGTYADRALEAVSSNRKITYAQLAVALYGNDTEVSKNKARSVIYFLMKKAKKLRGEPGAWEVITDG